MRKRAEDDGKQRKKMKEQDINCILLALLFRRS
jgi:hypothetical protein